MVNEISKRGRILCVIYHKTGFQQTLILVCRLERPKNDRSEFMTTIVESRNDGIAGERIVDRIRARIGVNAVRNLDPDRTAALAVPFGTGVARRATDSGVSVRHCVWPWLLAETIR